MILTLSFIEKICYSTYIALSCKEDTLPQFTSYSQHELEILAPLGGPDFVERVVKTIRTADAAAYSNCLTMFSDPNHCDVIGEMRRTKINEELAGLAIAMGLDYSYEKPGRQRYNNLVIRAEDTILTVARMYGWNRVSRPSGFRVDLAQMRLNLFGETDDAYTVPDDNVRALILTYEVGLAADHPVVTNIELHEIGVSPEDVTCRIDLGAKVGVQSVNTHEVVFDDFDIKPKEGLMWKHA